MTCRLEFNRRSWSRSLQDDITVCIGVDDTISAHACDEHFAVTTDQVIEDFQQSRRKSFVEQYVTVSVSIEQRPVW